MNCIVHGVAKSWTQLSNFHFHVINNFLIDLLSACLFNLYAEYIMQNARLDEAQLESSLQGEISITSDMQMTPPLWQRVKRY